MHVCVHVKDVKHGPWPDLAHRNVASSLPDGTAHQLCAADVAAQSWACVVA